MTRLKISKFLLTMAAGIGALAAPVLASAPAHAATCTPDPYNGVCVAPVTYQTTLRTQVQRTPRMGNASRGIRAGTPVGVVCQITNGPSANGHSATSWSAIAGGGWIYDSYLTTPKAANNGVRKCGTSTNTNPGSNPAPSGSTTRSIDPGNYPWPTQDGWVNDQHGYYEAECVSFAAWAVRADNVPDTKSPDFMGDARKWTGAYVDSTPHVGDVAQWDGGYGGAGSVGHVAYVSAVNSNGSVVLMEYNWGNFHRLNIRTVPANTPSRYLHF